MLEVSQLQTLVAVARYGSFSKAAEEMGVTQSAISQSIKNLEKKVDSILFKRSGKHVVLTEEGDKLHSLATDVLTKFDDVLEEISMQKNAMKGKIRIGTLYGIGKSWLGAEVIDFSSQYPEVSMRVTLGVPQYLISQFENYRLDVLVVPDFAIPPSGKATLIGEERSVLVIPKKAQFAIPKNPTVDELASLPTLLFESHDALYTKWMRERFSHVPKKVNKRLIINSHGNILNAVSKGLGVAVVPTHVLARSRFKTEVDVYDEKSEVSNAQLYFVTHKENENLTRISALKERLLENSVPLS